MIKRLSDAKDRAIKKLLKDDLNYLRDNSAGEEWIELILVNGFKGYLNQSLKELKAEIKAREL